MAEFVTLDKIQGEGVLNFIAKVVLLGTKRKSKTGVKYVRGVFQDQTDQIPFSVFSGQLFEILENAYKNKQALKIKRAKCKIDKFSKDWTIVLTSDTTMMTVDAQIETQDKPTRKIEDVFALSEEHDGEFIEIDGECIKHYTEEIDGQEEGVEKKYIISTYNFIVYDDMIHVRHWGEEPIMTNRKNYNLFGVQYDHGRCCLFIKPYTRITEIASQ